MSDYWDKIHAEQNAAAVESLSREVARLTVIANKALRELGACYVKLADVRHQWEGRGTEEGQGLLCGILGALSDLAGKTPMETRDAFEAEIYEDGNIEDRAGRAIVELRKKTVKASVFLAASR